jgi:hypothetical protein
MSLVGNLSKGKAGVAFVRSKMTVGASNKAVEVFRSYGGSLLCVLATRSVEISVPRGPVPNWIREMAAKAENVGCGNCGEQAALAFMYLYEQLHSRPLDFMARTNRDHAFVVIGRTNKSKDDDYTTWGNEAVVCDPWDLKAYAAAEIPTKAYGGAKPFGVESYSRVD